METFNFNSLNLKKIKTAIDVGCGNGRHLKSLGFRLSNAKIIGIDQSVQEITKLQNEFSEHICKNQNSYEFLMGDVRSIEIEDNSQDRTWFKNSVALFKYISEVWNVLQYF